MRLVINLMKPCLKRSKGADFLYHFVGTLFSSLCVMFSLLPQIGT